MLKTKTDSIKSKMSVIHINSDINCSDLFRGRTDLIYKICRSTEYHNSSN